MKRAVVVICDGLRADMLRPEWTPNLCRLAESARVFLQHRSVFPSTTRTTAASIATGCHPARHGLEGNCVALDEGKGLTAVSVGPLGFRERLKAATGHTLRVPTLSERLVNHGEGIIYSNVSPGAAYFHDPDGHGYVYHRSGSFGPGLQKISSDDGHLDVSHDASGDTEMTARFCDEILGQRKPAYALLWQCEPDHTQHAKPLGSPEHLKVIATADANAGRITAVVDQLNENGEDILLIIASDHGHETVSGVLPLSDLLIEAGLKDGPGSTDVVIASNGLSAHIYITDEARSRIPGIIGFLEHTEGIARVFSGDQLAELGHKTDTPLAISLVTERTDDKNPYGIPGISLAVEDDLHADTNLGCGQHGGLGPYEQNPFLMIRGGGFVAGSHCNAESSAIDLAPTILRHLGVDSTGMDGQALEKQ